MSEQQALLKMGTKVSYCDKVYHVFSVRKKNVLFIDSKGGDVSLTLEEVDKKIKEGFLKVL